MTRPLSLLVIEDDAGLRHLIAQYLLHRDCTITLASGSRQALDEAGHGQFDLFVVDIRLNERMTGLDLLGELRGLPGYESTPAIACTVYTSAHDRQRLLDAGFNEHVGKPFEPDELWACIQKALDEAGS